MIIDGDQFIFELIINANENQHEVTSVEQIQKRSYRITIEAVADNTFVNTKPFIYNTLGNLVDDLQANSYLETRLTGKEYNSFATNQSETTFEPPQTTSTSAVGTAVDPNIVTVHNQILRQVTQVNTIQIVSGFYQFNNIPYSDNDFVVVTNGTYTITSIPSAHPIGFVTTSPNFRIISGTTHGNPANTSIYGSETLSLSVQHYYNDLTFEITGDIGTISYHCYYHGYMGGENRMKYFTP